MPEGGVGGTLPRYRPGDIRQIGPGRFLRHAACPMSTLPEDEDLMPSGVRSGLFRSDGASRKSSVSG